MPFAWRPDEEIAIKFVPPLFVRVAAEQRQILEARLEEAESGRIDEASELWDDLEERARRQDVRLKLLEGWWSKHEVLLVGLTDEISNSAGLLALRKQPPSVRFYQVACKEIHLGKSWFSYCFCSHIMSSKAHVVI